MALSECLEIEAGESLAIRCEFWIIFFLRFKMLIFVLKLRGWHLRLNSQDGDTL